MAGVVNFAYTGRGIARGVSAEGGVAGLFGLQTKKRRERPSINTATFGQLVALPGVGPAIARAIVAGRPWKAVEDLTCLRGVTLARVASWEVCV